MTWLMPLKTAIPCTGTRGTPPIPGLPAFFARHWLPGRTSGHPLGTLAPARSPTSRCRCPSTVTGSTGAATGSSCAPPTWVPGSPANSKILDIFEKQGRSGPLVFVVRQETQTNQLGQTVSLAKRVSIHRSLPEQVSTQGADGDTGVELGAVPLSPPAADVILPKPGPVESGQRYFDDVAVGGPAAAGNQGPIDHDPPGSLGRGQRQLRSHPLGPALRPVGAGGFPTWWSTGRWKNQYLGQLLIDFAGEEGWFKRLFVQHRGMDFPGRRSHRVRRCDRKEGGGRGSAWWTARWN